MNPANLKVGARLAAGFGAVVLALLVVAGAGLYGLRALDDTVEQTTRDLFPKTVLANEVVNDINVIARAMRNTLLLDNAEAAAKEVARVKEARARIGKTLADLDQRIQSADGRAVLAKAMAARDVYVVDQEEFLALVAAGKTDAAKTFLLTKVRAEQQAYLDAVNKVIAFQTALMTTAGQDATALADRVQLALAVVSAIAVLLAMVIAALITRSITRPLQRAVGVAEAVASGDLTQRIEAHSNDETGQLLTALGTMNDKLRTVIGQIRASTEAVGSASQQIATGNADLSQRTEEQASSLEETASSMEELTSTVKQNSDNARQANQLAASASDVAAKGGAVVDEVVSTMGAISDSSKKIGDIIGVIDGIAFQTNILALNAAVEAARAGEQGRGFAVVASEVRSLAQRSAAAAKEIKALIGDSVAKVDAGAKLVTDAGQTMAEVVASVKRVTDIMAEITAASLEQSSGIEQVNQAIVQMDQVTQQNAALVEESAAAAESMADQARELASAVSVFRMADGDGVMPAQTAIAKAQAVAGTEASPAAAATGTEWSGVERRGPHRATNVTRPKFGARAQPGKARDAMPVTARRTGTDDEWAEF